MDDAEYYGRERQLYGDGTVELYGRGDGSNVNTGAAPPQPLWQTYWTSVSNALSLRGAPGDCGHSLYAGGCTGPR